MEKTILPSSITFFNQNTLAGCAIDVAEQVELSLSETVHKTKLLYGSSIQQI